MNPTNLTRILTLRAQPDGSDRAKIGFIKHIQGWTRIWTLFEVNMTRLDLKIGPKIGLNSKNNGLCLAALDYTNSWIYFPIFKIIFKSRNI